MSLQDGMRRLSFGLAGSRRPVVYEVTLAIDPERIDELDEWLPQHAREMLAFPGFQAADIHAGRSADEQGRMLRTVAYRVRSRRELDSYLHTHAKRMRAEGMARFGKIMSASRRIVPDQDYQPDPDMTLLQSTDDISGGLPVCGNCLEPVPGRFCAQCGQEDRTYLLSLRELLSDFFGDLINFDSRFFKTMVPLLFRPGYLTAEYIRGRRQTYFPPVRLYIFISIVFFFVATVLADVGDFKLDDDSEPQTLEEAEARALGALESQRASLETRGALQAAEPFLPSEEDVLAGVRERYAERQLAEAAEPPAKDGSQEDSDAAGTQTQGPGVQVSSKGVHVQGFGIPEIDARLERGAEAFKEDPGAFAKAMLDDIPVAMFIFLPLIALVLKVLYFFTGRYYVEHLIFTLHFHAAAFMLILLLIANGELEDAYESWRSVSGWVDTILGIYLPIYLFRSLRVVYGQGRLMTSGKFFLLFLAYVVAAGLTLALTAVLTLLRQST
ncbi:MAG: DUF4286 family protein [Gammaproteobacteria bacterium]|nr:DUF4286 family protein [Gammaproteobacteria bacterium]